MAMKQANAAERKWMCDIAEWLMGNLHILYGEKCVNKQEYAPQLHHVTGRSSKQNKVPIGHYFILPVPFSLHDVSSNDRLNVTHRKKSFTAKFGMQRDLFSIMYHSMMEQGYTVPPIEIFNAIMSTSE